MSGISKRVSGSWNATTYGIMKTATDTITTLPADLYADGNNATVGLVGNMSQTGTPTPQNPIYPSETGDRTENLFDGIYQRAILSVSGATATYVTSSSGRVAVIPCEPSTTYTVKKYDNSNRFAITESDTLPENGDVLSVIISNNTLTEYTFTTSATAKYISVYVSTSSEQAEPKMTVTEGSTAPTSYIPYGIKIPISSANTTTPVYLGEVETTRKIKKLVLTGGADENWTAHGTISSWFQLLIDNAVINNEELCTHYKPSTHSASNIENGEILLTKQSATNNGRIIIRDTSCANVDAFKAYLAEQYANATPVVVYYVLATPTTGIVNEPLRKIGDYADTVSGITIPTIAGKDTFDVQTTLKPSEVTVNYHGWHTGTVHERESGAWD